MPHKFSLFFTQIHTQTTSTRLIHVEANTHYETHTHTCHIKMNDHTINTNANLKEKSNQWNEKLLSFLETILNSDSAINDVSYVQI